MTRVLLELAVVVLFWGAVGTVIVRHVILVGRLQKAKLEAKRAAELEEADLRRRQREAAAWQAEYDAARERLQREEP